MQREFEKMIEVHSGLMFKVGRAYCQNNSDFNDLQQEMMIQLWKSFNSFRGESKRSTWVYRVCLNTAISFIKNEQKRKKTVFSYDFNADMLVDSAVDAEKERMSQAFYGCINELKKDEKAVVLLYLEEKKYQEISSILGISVSLVGVKINRIKKKLEKCISPKLKEDE